MQALKNLNDLFLTRSDEIKKEIDTETWKAVAVQVIDDVSYLISKPALTHTYIYNWIA